jgi:hypothetical protein
MTGLNSARAKSTVVLFATTPLSFTLCLLVYGSRSSDACCNVISTGPRGVDTVHVTGSASRTATKKRQIQTALTIHRWRLVVPFLRLLCGREFKIPLGRLFVHKYSDDDSAALRLLIASEPFSCNIQTLDVWTGAFRQLSAGPRDPSCRVCGARQFDFLDNRRRVPVSLCGRNAVQLHEHTRTLNLRELADRLRPLGDVRVNEFALRLSLEKYQLTFFPDGRAIVKGTTDVGVARGVYARLIGA